MGAPNDEALASALGNYYESLELEIQQLTLELAEQLASPQPRTPAALRRLAWMAEDLESMCQEFDDWCARGAS